MGEGAHLTANRHLAIRARKIRRPTLFSHRSALPTAQVLSGKSRNSPFLFNPVPALCP